MKPGLGAAIGTFPAPGSANYATSGLALGVGGLAGTSAVADEAVGSGRVVSFASDPNFRAWTQGTQRLLWNAIVGPNPAGMHGLAAGSKERAAAEKAAQDAAATVVDFGSAIRIRVRAADATATAKILSRRGAEVARFDLGSDVLFLVANRKDLSAEESPLFDFVVRDLDKAGIDPLAREHAVGRAWRSPPAPGSARDVDHAEAVALGVGEDHVVGVGRLPVPVDLGRPEADEALDLGGLVLGVEVEVDPGRDMDLRADAVERDVGSVAGARPEQREALVVAALRAARHVVERRRPERLLALEVVDADDDRADADHPGQRSSKTLSSRGRRASPGAAFGCPGGVRRVAQRDDRPDVAVRRQAEELADRGAEVRQDPGDPGAEIEHPGGDEDPLGRPAVVVGDAQLVAVVLATGRTIAIAAVAVRSERVWGTPISAIWRRTPTSVTTMNRHGWVLLLLPVQRATSAIASSSARSTGSSVNSRIWRVRRRGRSRSAGVSVIAPILLRVNRSVDGGSTTLPPGSGRTSDVARPVPGRPLGP